MNASCVPFKAVGALWPSGSAVGAQSYSSRKVVPRTRGTYTTKDVMCAIVACASFVHPLSVTFESTTGAEMSASDRGQE